MAVSAGGAIAGSVSGGCIEGAGFDACQEAIRSGQARLLHFGVADDEAWEVGLACGGIIDVFVEPLNW
jgi:xanthine/CO dehydrogenase XdhC/CoxF family maturation factor